MATHSLGTFLLTIPLAIAHSLYSWKVSYFLFTAAGGVRQEGRWTQYGGVDFAWTHLPALPGPIAGGFGGFLMLTGSVASAYFLSSLILRGMDHVQPLFGLYRWRLIAVLLGWVVWFPVPVKWAAVYGWTVAY